MGVYRRNPPREKRVVVDLDAYRTSTRKIEQTDELPGRNPLEEGVRVIFRRNCKE